MGVPIAGGFYREQISRDSRNERYRCSAWVQTRGQSILIDAGPEFRLQSIRAEIQHIDSVLITHEHMDHIAGLDDLRAYNYKQECPLPLYCTPSCAESILKRFDYMFGEHKYPGSTSLDIKPVTDAFTIKGGIEVTPLPVMQGTLPINVFPHPNIHVHDA
jgi:phosphoribosyl 1,2-cyclic phosphate phosphodiesterase